MIECADWALCDGAFNTLSYFACLALYVIANIRLGYMEIRGMR